MLILHTFFALLAGFLTIAAIIALATVLLARFKPGESSTRSFPPRYLWINLSSSLVAAVAGGYATATFSRENPLIHSLALALIILLLAALSAVQSHQQSRGRYPIWFSLPAVALTPCAVVLGGLLRLKMLGVI